ncbi:prephenate dehydratase [Aneurinibacillus sp. Ricciae_BoGa-3]|uniref:prephenate dehydratase n=1 Tax=Aneurinibacillus sp. Ricciae_BoGa-3 TaxID=3022697 RepID=UPI0023418F9C|nr:prephenate dehydratase [Aneurinibacillus sp. Ricciae_BoGa-3]WCK53626.1 prephenate dehydratase [Aneurinibacillus sp. Ricciae_BoGa-3]
MERKIAFFGPHGTNTEEAARVIFNGETDRLYPYRTIPDCLEAVADNQADFAVVPLENSIEGSVNVTVDWLIHKVDLPIRAEISMPIGQHLMAGKRKTPVNYKEIEKVLSHPQAIAQSHDYLRKYLPQAEIEYTTSTAEAARIISKNPEMPWLAVAPRLALDVYPLTMVQEHIEDNQNNFTRFIIVGESGLALPSSGASKTKILVALPADFPGALYQVLAAFAWRKINLSRIESRPTKTGLGNYHFIIDIEQEADDVLLPGAFAEIEALGCQVRLLGTYSAFMKQETASLSSNK